MAATILVCINCKGAGAGDGQKAGQQLADAIETELATTSDSISLLRVNCLANCTRGPSAVLRAEKSWSYVFGQLSPGNAPDIITGAALLDAAADGLMPWRGRPDCLKRGMIARIPPLDFAGEQP